MDGQTIASVCYDRYYVYIYILFMSVATCCQAESVNTEFQSFLSRRPNSLRRFCSILGAGKGDAGLCVMSGESKGSHMQIVPMESRIKHWQKELLALLGHLIQEHPKSTCLGNLSLMTS